MKFLQLSLLVSLYGVAAFSEGDLAPVHTLELRGGTYHVQGIDLNDAKLWVTSVDKTNRKGYLQEFSMPTGDLVRTVELTDGERFHPGGLSLAGDSLWIPVAEYRRNSTSVVQKRSARTLKLEFQFPVSDHIGCLTVTPDAVIGANWDSRELYFWDQSGHLLRKVPNPTENAYQDIKFTGGFLVGSGLLPDHSGAVDWLAYPSLHLIRRVPMGKTNRGVAYTNEGMTVRGDRLFLLPEDFSSRLFEFHLEPPAR